MKKNQQNIAPNEESSFSLSIGDLMAALLLIFVLLLAATLLRLQTEYDKRILVAEAYKNIQDSLYQDLHEEFDSDLKEWNAEFRRIDLSLRFKEPDVLFAQGQSNLREKFTEILDSFFPRYIAILTKDVYKDKIEEVRIEGHTSSEWQTKVTQDEAYFLNMELSQDRTRSVLEYCFTTLDSAIDKSWVMERITANGLSFSHLIKENGVELKEQSRRVEFRIKTNAEKELLNMMDITINR